MCRDCKIKFRKQHSIMLMLFRFCIKIQIKRETMKTDRIKSKQGRIRIVLLFHFIAMFKKSEKRK